MLSQLLPEGVVSVEAFEDDLETVVFPGEEEYVVAPHSARGREFVTARRCAREALEQLGFPPAPIRVGARREPLWPDGVVGAITHCPGYRAAAVSRSIASVGMDAEPNGPLPPGVLEQVASLAERKALDGLAREDSTVNWDRLLFTAKEAVYKAWFPLTGRWLGFEDAVVVIDRAAGTFHADLMTPGVRRDTGVEFHAFDGTFRAVGGLLLSAVTFP
ncbi:4'-phosphopantetheinyl transferase superfamily protein [Nocardioides sp. InS609-2]|uniref:4'-phosphopantetheinyl transferase family protein n=1 Tax=Nocardioides sp. InS609-2 TaxID=2760705 RepID=UPI0024A6960F|nr:4'-phosphopantetheinyl transferase superfamily protein [Nocardioides sp. InS609-2]